MKRRNCIDDPEKKKMIEKLLPAGHKKWSDTKKGYFFIPWGFIVLKN